MTQDGALPAVAGSQETVPLTQGQLAEKGLQDFEDLILKRLRAAGLPTEDVLVSLKQRGALLSTAEHALSDLTGEQRARSAYIAKMIMAGSVGLFDAALNYLWDETVIELRKRVIGYDLTYFYAVAEKSDSRRKELKTAEDLVKLDDAKLLSGAREIGLISDVGYHQIDNIRFMRNYASAAHPNQITLTGLQLADWLETCIREVINLPHDTVVAEIQKLLVNVKAKLMDNAALAQTAAFFKGLPSDQADTLATGLFSVYTTMGIEPFTLDNIRALWPKLWDYVSEEARHGFGVRLGRFQANADHDQAILARQLIDLVQGAAYLPEEIVATEMAETLEELINTHLGWDNFYNETGVAQKLAELVGQQSTVPTALAQDYVRTLVRVFLTNGHGVASGADPIYRDLISRFDPQQAAHAIRSFADPEISSQLQRALPQSKWSELLDIVDIKLTGRPDRDLLEEIRNFNGTPDKLRLDTAIRQRLAVAQA